MTTKAARLAGERLAEEFGSGAAAINVEDIARQLGLEVVYDYLGPDVSGLLVTNDHGACIAVQDSDHPNRQRFTIAHEVGHFVLRHQFQRGEHVHVDRGNFISQRGPRASTGTDHMEIEANQFAAGLLMPGRLLRRRVRELARGGPLLDHLVRDLATEFGVSEQAMTIRLTTLGLL